MNVMGSNPYKSPKKQHMWCVQPKFQEQMQSRTGPPPQKKKKEMKAFEHDFPFQHGDFQVNQWTINSLQEHIVALRISRDPPMEEFEPPTSNDRGSS